MNNVELIKSILNLPDNSQEPTISYTCNMVETKVRIYCRYDLIEQIPTALNDIIVDIAINQCRLAISNSTSSITSTVSTPTVGVLTKKTIGGTSYEYDTSAEAMQAASSADTSAMSTATTNFLSDYTTFLNAFKKKRVVFI